MATLYPAVTNNDVVTSWVPLTAVCTAPSTCSGQFRLDGPSLVAFDPGYGLDISTDVICAPPAVTTWWEQGLLGEGNTPGHTAVSLGPMTCPSAWSTVATSVKATSSTIATCCPSGYYLADGYPGSIAGNCLSDMSSGMSLTFASTPASDSTAWTIVTTTLSESSTVGAIAVVGWNIEMTGSSTTSSSSSLPTPSSSIPLLPSSTSLLPSTTSSPAIGGSSGLTTGAAVGIGVSVALGVLGAVALVVAFYLTRRRKDRTAMPAQMNEAPTGKPTTPEQVHEASAAVLHHELPSQEIPVELDGSDAPRHGY